MNQNPDFLFDLIPVIYRLRDAAQGAPLQALLRVIAEQAGVVEQDIAQLYENWFIETCDDWVVPYIGALVGYTPVSTGPNPGTGSRALARERITHPATRSRQPRSASAAARARCRCWKTSPRPYAGWPVPSGRVLSTAVGDAEYRLPAHGPRAHR